MQTSFSRLFAAVALCFAMFGCATSGGSGAAAPGAGVGVDESKAAVTALAGKLGIGENYVSLAVRNG